MLKTSPAPASLGQELGPWGLPRPWAGQGEPSGKGAAEPAVPSGHGQSGPYGAAEISESSLIRSSAARLGNFRFRLKIKRKLKKKKNLRPRFLFDMIAFLARQDILMMFFC